MAEAKAVMSSVVKLSEDSVGNAWMLEKLVKERRYFELNGLTVEPRFAEKPLHTARDPWIPAADQEISIHTKRHES
jgi:hypothetical protein